MQDEWMYDRNAEYDRILGQTTGLLAQRGDEEAVALLVDVQSMALADTGEVIRTEKVFDPWAPAGDDGPAIGSLRHNPVQVGSPAFEPSTAGE
jgi:hypothetical protein